MVLVVSEVLLLSLFTCVGALLHGALAWSVLQATRTHTTTLLQAVVHIERTLENFSAEDATRDVVNTIQAEMAGLIEDTLGSMHVPTAQDHFMGGIMQAGNMLLQRWMLKDMPPEVMQALQAGVLPDSDAS